VAADMYILVSQLNTDIEALNSQTVRMRFSRRTRGTRPNLNEDRHLNTRVQEGVVAA
jgi:hypothetical protein